MASLLSARFRKSPKQEVVLVLEVVAVEVLVDVEVVDGVVLVDVKVVLVVVGVVLVPGSLSVVVIPCSSVVSGVVVLIESLEDWEPFLVLLLSLPLELEPRDDSSEDWVPFLVPLPLLLFEFEPREDWLFLPVLPLSLLLPSLLLLLDRSRYNKKQGLLVVNKQIGSIACALTAPPTSFSTVSSSFDGSLWFGFLRRFLLRKRGRACLVRAVFCWASA